MRGWKRSPSPWTGRVGTLAGHSAPTMRGWKHIILALPNRLDPGRTLSPDNEGMETRLPKKPAFSKALAGHSAPTMRGWKLGAPVHDLLGLHRRTLSPDNEGMETRVSTPSRFPWFPAGHSAPTMRGWKPGQTRRLLQPSLHSARRTLSPDNEGMETVPASSVVSGHLAPDTQPRQ